METYLLVRALCSALGDSLGMASALCQLTKLLFQLECPSYAQVSLAGRERAVGRAWVIPEAAALRLVRWFPAFPGGDGVLPAEC